MQLLSIIIYYNTVTCTFHAKIHGSLQAHKRTSIWLCRKFINMHLPKYILHNFLITWFYIQFLLLLLLLSYWEKNPPVILCPGTSALHLLPLFSFLHIATYLTRDPYITKIDMKKKTPRSGNTVYSRNLLVGIDSCFSGHFFLDMESQFEHALHNAEIK